MIAPVPPDSVVPCGHPNAVALSVVNKPAAINVLIFFIFVCSMKALVPVIKLAIIQKIEVIILCEIQTDQVFICYLMLFLSL